MTLEFDGKMIFDQLPLVGTETLKLESVKIFSGKLSSSTLQIQVPVASTTDAYSRSQFEPSSPAATLFQDDMESVLLSGLLHPYGASTLVCGIAGHTCGRQVRLPIRVDR